MVYLSSDYHITLNLIVNIQNALRFKAVRFFRHSCWLFFHYKTADSSINNNCNYILINISNIYSNVLLLLAEGERGCGIWPSVRNASSPFFRTIKRGIMIDL